MEVYKLCFANVKTNSSFFGSSAILSSFLQLDLAEFEVTVIAKSSIYILYLLMRTLRLI